MTRPAPRRPVEVLEPHRLRLREVPTPSVPPAEQLRMDEVWAQAAGANHGLFDGPVAACAGLEWQGPPEAGTLELSWTRTTYRRYALRRVPDATAGLPSLYVTVVQPVNGGGLLVGRAAKTTASPGRWQLPGGSVDQPPDHHPLDERGLRSNAARELQEEIGHAVSADDLTRLFLTYAPGANLGVHYRAPSAPEGQLISAYEELCAREASLGRTPEFDRLTVVRSTADLTALGDQLSDYLIVVATRHLTR